MAQSGAKQMTPVVAKKTDPNYALTVMPEHKQAAFKNSTGAFYGVSSKEAEKIDYNKLY